MRTMSASDVEVEETKICLRIFAGTHVPQALPFLLLHVVVVESFALSSTMTSSNETARSVQE
mgnify:CR=1 FL=1